MTPEQLKNTPVVDYRPFIIADADTGTGATRTCATSCGASSSRVPAITSRTRSPAPRSAATRRQGARVDGRPDQAPQRGAPAARHHARPGISCRARTPSRRRSSTTAATSATAVHPGATFLDLPTTRPVRRHPSTAQRTWRQDVLGGSSSICPHAS